MPLNPKPQAHGKRKIQAGVSGGSNVTSLNLDGTTLQLNQSNSQPQRTVSLNSLSSTPGGNNTELQYNNGGSFGGIDDLKWDGDKLLLGDSSDTGNYLLVEGSDSDNTYNVLEGKRKYPRIRLTDTANSKTQDIWVLGSQLRIGSNGGTSSNAAMIVHHGDAGNTTFNGNVGIGTTSPQQPLHVLTSANDKGILIDVSDDTHEGRLLFGDTSSNAVGHIGYNHSLEAMRFFVNSTEQLRITDNVITLGDGVVLAPDASDNFTIDSPNGIVLDGTSATNGVQYHDGGLEIMRISNSSSNPVIRTMVDAKDMIFQQFDGTEVIRFKDNLDVEVAGGLTVTGDITGSDDVVINDDLVVKDNISLDSDSAVLLFGDDGEVNLTHVHDAGLILNSTNYLAFGSSANRIFANSGVLSLYGNSEVELNATNIDINGAVDISGNTNIGGNLTVQGTTTTIDSTTLSVKDKNIEMGVVSSPTDVTADGGGITLKGTTDKTFNWIDSTDSWTASEHIELASGKSFRINGNNVLNQTTLGSTVVSSSLTSLGTLTALTGGTGDLNWDSNTLFVDSSENRVGIGTNSPDVLFDVSGAAVIQSLRINANDGDRMRLYRRASNEMVIASESASLYLNSAYNGIYFENASSDVKMRMTNDGDFGIGTTAPAEKLDVAGNIRAEASSKSIVIDPYFVVSGDNQYSMISGSAGLALYPNDSYTDFWVHSASRAVRFRAVASDGSFDAGSFLEIFPDSIGATGDANANIRNSSGNLTLLTTGDDDIVINSHDSLNLFFDNEYQIYSAADGNPRFMMRDATVASMEFDNSQNIKFKNATSTKMTLDTANGRLGIGTTSPAELLDVRGKILIDQYLRLQRNTSTNGLNLTDSGGNVVPLHGKGGFFGDGFALNPDSSELILYKSTTGSTSATAGKVKFASRNDAGTAMPYAEIEGIAYDDTASGEDGHIVFRTENASTMTEQMRITNDKVGIGTSSPSEKFYVETSNNTVSKFKSTDNRGLIQVSDDDTTVSIVAENSTASIGQTSQLAATNININTSGDLGIGTTSPQRKLHVMTASAGSPGYSTYATMILESDDHSYFQFSSPSNKVQGINFGDGNDNAGAIYYDHASDYMRFFAGAAERVRIDSSGRVGIGTNSPSEALELGSGNLRLNGDSTAISIYDADGTETVRLATASGDEGLLYLRGPTGGNSIYLDGNSNSYINNGANFGIGTTSPGETFHVAGTSRVTGKAAFGSSTLPTANGISVSNTIQVAERSSAPDHVDTWGVLWVKNDDPTNLYFTDDDGNDIALTNNGSAAGGGGTPGGSNTQLQYNNGGAFGGMDDWTWDGTDLNVAGSSKLKFNDSTRYIAQSGDNLLIRNEAAAGSNINLNAKNDIKFFIDGQQKMHIDSNGNVGMGTTAPAAKLHVDGDIRIDNGHTLDFDARGYIDVNVDGATGEDEFFFRRRGSSNEVKLDMSTAGAPKLGIGITSPDAPLHILKAAGGANIVTALKLDPDDTTTNSGVSIDFNASTTNTGASLVGSRIIGAREGSNASGFLALYTSPDATSSVPLERMRITSAGKVGIGTTSPNSKMTVQGDLDIPVNSRFRAGSGGAHTGLDIYFNNTDSNSVIENRPSGGDLVFRQMHDGKDYIFKADNDSGTEQEIMRIDGSNARVGIGTNTPGQKLDVDGNLRVRDSHTLAAGDADDLFLYHDGNSTLRSNTGIFNIVQNTSDNLNITANGGDVVIDSNIYNMHSGLVGIGTSSPSYNLDVVDNAADHNYVAVTNTTAGTSSLAGFRLQSQTANGLIIGHADNRTVSRYGITLAGYTEILSSTGNGMIIGNSHGAPLIFGTANVERMRILSGGNVGIGTTAPDEKLHVVGAIEVDDGASKQLKIDEDSISGLTDNDIKIHPSGNSNQFVLNRSNARIGMGTSSPTELLHVFNNSVNTMALFESGDSNAQIRIKDSASTQYIMSDSSTLSMGSQNDLHASNLNIDSAGNVGIGTTTPSQKLDVVGAAQIGTLIVTGSTLAVQREMKNDITSSTTLSDSYSVYQALADGGGVGTVTLTAPSSPSTGDTYLIVAGAFGNPGGGGAPTLTGLVRIIANTGQTINGVNTNITLMQSTALQPEYKTAHLVCVDTDTWVLTLSAQGPVA